MAATTITIRPPAPVEIARATAAAIPSEISTRPLLGIIGVLIGAGLVTLTARMLSLGMADLKGHVGIGYDQGAWLDSAYNGALMFIGPLTVFLGGLLGPRRVLLFTAGLFTATCAFLPLIHSYSLLATALIVAGLTSGTFYPLTLTYALRISPLRFLPITMAFYATFIDGAVNVAPSLYGWYRDHLSWHWMFWNSALIAPVMLICIYFGIPKAPARQKSGPAPSFIGFLYLSCGLALMFIALQQGQRLDWWRSGVFTGLFWSGAFLILCALIRRLRGPNPLVALPYLWRWNTVLLGSLLFWFRFTLTGTIILIPQSLAIHGFEASQIGPAIIWSAAPLLLIALTAGLLMLDKLDPRLVLAAGLSCTAFAVLLNSEYTTAWSAANYYRTELLTGVGQAISLIGLVGCIILQGVFTGGLAKPPWILTFSAFFHTIRLFGGQAGAIYMAHFLDEREKLHSNLLGLHVTSGNWITDANLHGMAAGVYAKSYGANAAAARAADLIGARLRLQAYALSLNDGFVLVAWSCVVGLLLTALLRKSPLNYGDLPTFQQPSSEHKESNS
ncbi:MAG TPA: MFS transporter [Candidatus Sulfotelmatobacter sp.]|nr:MFS transporter [Candidatus Sulfotelmatobacter sp.]